jgi:hypothetical protein
MSQSFDPATVRACAELCEQYAHPLSKRLDALVVLSSNDSDRMLRLRAQVKAARSCRDAILALLPPVSRADGTTQERAL